MQIKNTFHFQSYEHFLRSFFPANEKGKIKDLAKYIGVHPSRVSRIVKGQQPPTQEQAFLVAKFLELNDTERDYFLTLVDMRRASKVSFKKHLLEKLVSLRADQLRPAEMTPFKGKLTKGEGAVLFSSPLYYLVWLSSTLSHENTISDLAKIYSVSPQVIENICQFLVSVGLCIFELNRVYPLVRVIEESTVKPNLQAFLNLWHVQGLQKFADYGPDDVFFSLPMALGEKSYSEIRKQFLAAIDSAQKIAASESSEIIACLNVDLFQIHNSKR